MSEVKEWTAEWQENGTYELTDWPGYCEENEAELVEKYGLEVSLVPKSDLEALREQFKLERVFLAETYQREIRSKDQELQTLRTTKSAMSDVIEAKDQRIKELEASIKEVRNSIAIGTWNLDERFAKFAVDVSKHFEKALKGGV